MKFVELTAPRGEAKAQLSEAKLATSLQHPNVVRSSVCCHTGPAILMVLFTAQRGEI